MNNFKIQSTLQRCAALAAAGVLVSACSQVPDAVNPVEWYNSTVSFFSGDEKAKSKTDAQQADAKAKPGASAKDGGTAQPATDQAFPKLSRVDSQAEYEAMKPKRTKENAA